MPNILVVDDSSSLRESVVYILTQHNFNVSEAGNGEEALVIITKSAVKFNLIITDINMPSLDGISLIKKIKTMSDYRYIPIIVLSTESQDAKIREGKLAGATGWLLKPFSAEKLIAIVNKILKF